jgi:hypothetical protein
MAKRVERAGQSDIDPDSAIATGLEKGLVLNFIVINQRNRLPILTLMRSRS